MDDTDKATSPKAMNQQAWSLATARDAASRDAAKALEIASKLCEQDAYQNSMYLDTLAAAHAEAGHFDDAIKWENKAIDQNQNLAGIDRYQSRLELYRSRKPYHEGDALPAPNPLQLETPMGLNDQAWQLATAANPSLRNSKKAIEVATIACEKVDYQTPSYLDTLAAALAESGQFDDAVKREIQAISQTSLATSVDKYLGRLRLYRARKPYHEGDPLPPSSSNSPQSESLDVLNRKAWDLATSPDPSKRNGAKAIEIATQLCDQNAYKSSMYLDTLAAAHAEAGQFPQAILYENLAIDQHGDRIAIERLQSRLELYKAGKPYREGMTLPDVSLDLPLFNGKDLTGWTQKGGQDNHWSLDPDSHDLIVTGTGDPRKRGFLVSDADYDDFRLSFQFSPSTSDYDSAIALRAAPEECNDPSTNPVRVKLLQYDQYPNVKPGLLFWTPANQPGEILPLDTPPTLRPTGEWNDMTIELQGPNLRVSINNEDVFHTDFSTLVNRPNALPGLNRPSGRIAIQAHTGTVRYRNMRIQKLGQAKPNSTQTAPAPSPNAPSALSVLDALQPGTVWVGKRTYRRAPGPAPPSRTNYTSDNESETGSSATNSTMAPAAIAWRSPERSTVSKSPGQRKITT